ncbi:hypothetical protein TRFO_15380 [Tritrichomonas foetus]|uniref:F5/8 type C domain-containing protein n=1 Tax=Tritrichomonas foetus TaxID=1144522 RepID=A0A1J4KX96_9EUKA|nr:hypothetical protein TRFO_15380 [Tritrichomonas foetus]|eukprot:OHT14326.1 hypothetical protein TRFO_15380 [Tritrichomonas foetus]
MIFRKRFCQNRFDNQFISMTSMKSYTLSTEGFKNIPFSQIPNDFTFLCNGQKFHTSKLVADFLSPFIAKNHFTDPTNDFFEIKTNINGNFNEVIKLGQLQDISITPENIEFLLEVFEILGNNELINFLETPKDLTIETAIEALSLKYKCNMDNISKEIEFIASNFFEIDTEDEYISLLSKINPNILYSIFKHHDLVISSEDALLNLIMSLGFNYLFLLEFVLFREVTEDCFTTFLKSFDVSTINLSIWESIKDRFLEEKDLKNEKRYRNNIIIETFENDERYGIISHLYQLCQGNPCKKGLMKVTSSSIYFKHKPEYALDFDINKYFASDDIASQWILFDFMKREVIPQYYIIRSQCDFINNLKNWVLEGSKDGYNWKQLDKRINNSDLKEMNVVAKFHISNPFQCRYIRLKQIGSNWNGSEYLIITGIEFFGKLISK